MIIKKIHLQTSFHNKNSRLQPKKHYCTAQSNFGCQNYGLFAIDKLYL